MNQSRSAPVAPATPAKTRAVAQAVKDAQQLANADGRSYLVTRGTRSDPPLVEPLAGLESVVAFLLLESVDADRFLLVSPQGMHHGLTPAEIVATESQ